MTTINNLFSFLKVIARRTIATTDIKQLHKQSTGEWCVKYALLTKKSSNLNVPMI